jgi:hypothetical protein
MTEVQRSSTGSISQKPFSPPQETDHVDTTESYMFDSKIYDDLKISDTDRKELDIIKRYRRLCDYLSVRL